MTPQTQVVTGPERLVIDVPGAIPGRALHNQIVNRGQVERVRVGLFSAAPRVTRIVLDLNSPAAYSVQTDSSGFTVTLGANTPPPSKPAGDDGQTRDDGQTIGWVTAKRAAANIVDQNNPFVIASPVPVPVNPNGLRVAVGKGQLEIHARDATLSEVLFQVEQQTGADIAIPAGTEQQRVIGDFGPGKASEVLAQLLNGSDLNFVVVGSPNNPYAVRSVILTHKTPGVVEAAPPNNAPPPAASNAPPDNSANTPPDNSALQQPETELPPLPRHRPRHNSAFPPPRQPKGPPQDPLD